MAMRNDDYKLVHLATTDFNAGTSACVTTDSTEFYAIDQNVPPRIDNAESNLLVPPHVLDANATLAFASLTLQMQQLLDSNVPCVGDGNLDGVVDQADIEQLAYWANVTGSNSSWYDFNLDAFTNQLDVPYITQGMFPRICGKLVLK
jgi:hypothetical protein